MPEQTKEAEKKAVELTFDQKLFGAGWTQYYLSAHIENLSNPDSKQITLGFSDALTRKQIVINAPIEEWMRILTQIAKQAASKV